MPQTQGEVKIIYEDNVKAVVLWMGYNSCSLYFFLSSKKQTLL